MGYLKHDSGQFPVTANISHFPGQSGTDEYHLMMRPTEFGDIATQLSELARAYEETLDSLGLPAQTAIFRRFFLSDPSNQLAACETLHFSNPQNAAEPCAVSLIGQSPAPPAEVALWAYHVHDPQGASEKARQGASLKVKRGELTHHWTTGLTSLASETSADQTRGLFEQYGAYLQEQQLALADHVIRTWLFVRNIDANYEGLVAARREYFQEHGLTPETHFIASTGIEGAAADAAVIVSLDAYAIAGIRPEQIKFLSAPDHLGPTHVYGVTFERGVSVSYRDRKHVIISGTASIDQVGEILHPGDISRQLDRALENIEALLKNAGAAFEDMCMFIVYLREPSACAIVQERMTERFGDTPFVVVAAPVCRPGWLVELEGLAIVPTVNPQLPAF